MGNVIYWDGFNIVQAVITVSMLAVIGLVYLAARAWDRIRGRRRDS
jgi:hypothetical protein